MIRSHTVNGKRIRYREATARRLELALHKALKSLRRPFLARCLEDSVSAGFLVDPPEASPTGDVEGFQVFVTVSRYSENRRRTVQNSGGLLKACMRTKTGILADAKRKPAKKRTDPRSTPMPGAYL